MQISAMNSYNSQSFGNLVPTKSYKERLINNCTDKTVSQVANLTKKPLNIKELIGYENLSEEKQAMVDRYLAVMPKEEVENLTVSLDVHSSQDSEIFGIYHKASNVTYIDDTYLIAKLPVYNSKKDKIEYKKVDMGSYVVTKKFRDGYNELESEHYSKLSKVGFESGDTMTVPNESIFDVIGKEIMTHLNNQSAKEWDRNHSIETESNRARRKRLLALFG